MRITRHIRRSAGIAPFGAIACIGIVGAPAHGEAFWFIQDGEVVPLVTDGARIAVRTKDPAALAGIARGASVEPSPMPGWHIVTVAQVGRGADVRGAIDRVLADPGVALATPVFDGPFSPGPVMLTDQIFVRFAAGVGPDAQDRAIAEIPGAVVMERDFSGIAGLVRIHIASRSGLDALDGANLLAGRADVVYAEPDFIFTGSGSAIPNDTDFPVQWALQNTGQSGGTPGMDIGAVEAFDIEPGDPSTVIVVLDVGIDATHPDLSLAPGADFTTDPAPDDGSPVNICDRHGTWVAGCLSATINNSLGIAGGAGACRVASARIGISNNPACDGLWTGQLSWTVDALDWALSIGARVTNNSNAYSIGSTPIKNKYEQLRDAGIVHFASAGNNAAPSMVYPASLAAVQGVGAITRTGALASFSNFGTGLDYVAPGDAILSTDLGGALGISPTDFATVSGTSFSSPYAAAGAALLSTLKPGLSAPQIEAIVRDTATDLGAPGYDTTFGAGLVNARAALEFGACIDSWSPTGVSGPSPRTDHAMTYDSGRGVSVLFGGLVGAVPSSETWEHTGAAWAQRLLPGPSARSAHAMAYDGVRGVTVLFGGTAGGVASDETWEYDGAAWTLRATTGPAARSDHTMVFDSVRGVTILFGGLVGGIANGETWEWDGVAWTQVPIPGPSPRARHAMAFDAARNRAVVFGGSTGPNETWTYEGPLGANPGAWTLASTTGPIGRESAAFAFDARTETGVLFGGASGSNALGDTWEWTGAAWRRRSFLGPVGRSLHTMIYRDNAQDSFTYGGIDNSSITLGDAWTWYLPAPSIIDPPDTAQPPIGGPVVFTVVADGIGSVSHQWRKDGVDLVDGGTISGATTNVLTIANAQESDEGAYTVVVSDPCGTTVSASAFLWVGCAGDINDSGGTNISDFNILAGNFGAGPGATRAQGDLSSDGMVNIADFNILAGDFGCIAGD